MLTAVGAAEVFWLNPKPGVEAGAVLFRAVPDTPEEVEAVVTAALNGTPALRGL